MKVRPSAVVTVRVAGSTSVTSARWNWTVGAFLKMARSGRATSGVPSSPVATWYRSGWNWW